jgi:signal transduction histidine kinase
LQGRYELEVIDIYQQPVLAQGEQIIAVATLIKQLPLPLRRFIGDLSQTELDEFAKQHKDICWQIRLDTLDGEFPPLTQAVIYRLVQEILTNIGKHAKPSLVSVRVKQSCRRPLYGGGQRLRL